MNFDKFFYKDLLNSQQEPKCLIDHWQVDLTKFFMFLFITFGSQFEIIHRSAAKSDNQKISSNNLKKRRKQMSNGKNSSCGY